MGKRIVKKIGKYTEKKFQNDLMERIETFNWLIFHCRDSRHADGDKGFPDLVIAKRGQILFVELKIAGGRLSPDQVEWKANLGKNWRLVTPVNVEEFMKEVGTP